MANVANMVEVESLYCEGNVRSKECENIPQIVESYRRQGYKVNHPLVVSEKSDGRLLVLNGNRRTLGLFWLRDNVPDDYKSVVASGKVPAIVHRGLTQEEEVLLRIDHSSDEDRVPLDEWSIFLAVKQLVQIGTDTQVAIADKLGLYNKKGEPNRSWIQPRVALVRMPDFVQEELHRYYLNKSDSPLRLSHIMGLSKAFNAEYVDYPNADGPLFTERWAEIMFPPEKVEADTTDKALTPAEAVKRSQAASSKGLASALLAATGQGQVDMASIDRASVEGETAVLLLAKIREYLGDDDYRQLIDAINQEPVIA